MIILRTCWRFAATSTDRVNKFSSLSMCLWPCCLGKRLPLFWNFWKPGNVRTSAKVRERSGNLCSQGNLIVAAQQNNFPVLYSYCN